MAGDRFALPTCSVKVMDSLLPFTRKQTAASALDHIVSVLIVSLLQLINGYCNFHPCKDLSDDFSNPIHTIAPVLRVIPSEAVQAAACVRHMRN